MSPEITKSSGYVVVNCCEQAVQVLVKKLELVDVPVSNGVTVLAPLTVSSVRIQD